MNTETRPRPTPEELIGACLLISMVIILFIQVCSRFVLSSSLSWSEELSRYLFIWLIYLCLGSVVLRQEHIVIDVLVARLSPSARRLVETATLLLALALTILVLWVSADIALIFLELGQTSAALGIPMWWVYAALPVGMVLAAMRTVQALTRLWQRNSDELAGTQSAFDEIEVLTEPFPEPAHPTSQSAVLDSEGDRR